MQGFGFERGYGQTPEILAVLQTCLTQEIPYVYAETPRDVPPGYCPVGGVPFVVGVLAHNRIPVPKPLGYPRTLRRFLGRDVEIVPIDLALVRLACAPLFVKPANVVKGFTGQVFTESCELALLDAVQFGVNRGSKDRVPLTHVWVSSPVEIGQEWRVYCRRTKIEGMGRYDSGESPDDPPDTSWLKTLLAAYGKSAPAGYSLDVGKIDGKDILIEINDGWALGFYKGMDPLSYTSLLRTRYDEMLLSGEGMGPNA